MTNDPASTPLELWGGVECTHNRVGEEFFCQISRSGHLDRLSDLDLLADLGLRAIRYPVLWEKWAPDGFDSLDWSWLDARLHGLRERNVRPIAGLVHHGGGPRHTSLVDDEFATGLARWAGLVAERYPWLDAYTPVNEPLTTARFSTLYGLWFPHTRDDRLFARAMVSQCRATVLAMREIRRINPNAQLIQTEDIGAIYASPGMEYQAEFERARRWITFDILHGRVVAGHPMHHFLRWNGVSDYDLDWLRDNPCPPDVVGIDHYVTSNRFLDEHAGCYPEPMRGSNGRQEYVDVEAVRVDLPNTARVSDLLREAWERYGTPVALTEAHMGCTREEQMRWLQEVWREAQAARQQGVPVQAVTSWSLLGAHDWDSIVTRVGRHYEPGAFDVRSPAPRATALAPMLRALGRGDSFAHPVLPQPGWWQRPMRVLYDSPGVAAAREAMAVPASTCEHAEAASTSHAPPSACAPRLILIVGASGLLGSAFAYLCHARGLLACAPSRFECDILDSGSICEALDTLKPWAVVNAAGTASPERAEDDPEAAFALDARAAVDLARACAERSIPLAMFSSAQVFSGESERAYHEDDVPSPLGVLGRAKREMEEGVLQEHPNALIARAGMLFGPWDTRNFLVGALRTLERGHEARVPDDAILSPSYVPDLVNATLDLLLDGFAGVWHGASAGALSWHGFVLSAARRAGVSTERLATASRHEMPWKAPRPRNAALSSARAAIMAPLDEAMERFEHERLK